MASGLTRPPNLLRKRSRRRSTPQFHDGMNVFDHAIEDVARAKQERRARFLGLIRGWLRKERAPRWTVSLLLVVCAAFAALLDHWLQLLGIELRAMRWGAVALPCWPLFAVLLRWRAAAEFQKFELDRIGPEFLRHDEHLSASATTTQSSWMLDCKAGARQGLRAGLQQGGAHPLVLVVLSALTLGGWLVWELIQSAPSLLAEVMIDAELVRSQPSLATRIVTREWLSETLGATALHFFGLSVAAFLLGLSWVFDFL